MSNFLKITFFFILITFKLKSQAPTTYSVLSTAYDRTNSVFLPLGANDSGWVLTKIQDLTVPLNPSTIVLYPSTPSFVVPNVGNNSYAGIISNRSINNNSSTTSLGLKLITYRTYFTLPNLNFTNSRFSLSFKMCADDAVDNVRLNGVQRGKFLDSSYNNIPGISKPYLLNIPICDTGFVSGQNFIDITIADAGGSVGFYGEIELFETANIVPIINVNSTDTLVCAGQTVTVTATGANSYVWSGGSTATTPIIVVTPTVTTIYVVHTLSGFCSSKDSITVKVDTIPIAIISGSQTVCAGEPTMLTASGANSYTWGGGSTANTAAIIVSPIVTTNYTVTPSNGNCVGSPVSIVVTVNSSPIISVIATNTTICLGQSVTLTATGAASYQWNSSNVSLNTIVVSPTVTSTYIVQGSNGNCIGVDSITVYIISPITLMLPNYTVCVGKSITLIPVVSGGESPYVYNWGGGYNSSTYTTIPIADSVYSVSITDANGCFVSENNGNIHVLPPLAVNVQGINTCTADTINLLATATGGNGNYSYTWTPSNSHQNPLKLVAQSSTVYTIAVSDGCTLNNASDTALVNIIAAPQINISSVSGCNPVCINLTNIPYTSLSNWQWNFGDGSVLNTQKTNYCYEKPGVYNIIFTYTTTLGCKQAVTSNSLITVFTSPNAAFSASTFTTDIFNTDVYFYNESSGNISSQWFFGDLAGSTIQNPSHIYASVGEYPVELIVKNQNGCSDTVIHEVFINDIYTFYAPSAFTPNQDNYNELFLPIGTGWDNSSFKMLVFDRWGNLILTSTNPNQGWDGKIKGLLAQEDTYVWKVELKDVFRRSHSYAGVISIIR